MGKREGRENEILYLKIHVYIITLIGALVNNYLRCRATMRCAQIIFSLRPASSPRVPILFSFAAVVVIIFRETSERETARGEIKGARYGGIICDGSGIPSFARREQWTRLMANRASEGRCGGCDTGRARTRTTHTHTHTRTALHNLSFLATPQTHCVTLDRCADSNAPATANEGMEE